MRVSADTWGPSLLDNAAGCEHRAETAFEKTMCQISSSDSGKEMQMGLAACPRASFARGAEGCAAGLTCSSSEAEIRFEYNNN